MRLSFSSLVHACAFIYWLVLLGMYIEQSTVFFSLSLSLSLRCLCLMRSRAKKAAPLVTHSSQIVTRFSLLLTGDQLDFDSTALFPCYALVHFLRRKYIREERNERASRCIVCDIINLFCFCYDLCCSVHCREKERRDFE